MITLEALIVTTSLRKADVESWVTQQWVLPARNDEGWVFTDIDIARLQLIRELRYDLGMGEEALPVILRLMDQLYDHRRRLRRLRHAVENTMPADTREALLRLLME